MNIKQTIINALALALLALPLTAHAALRVVASLPSLAAIAREVGGKEVTVAALASPRQDPHFVDARPNLIVELSRADLLVEIGWLPALVRQSANAKILPDAAGHFDASRFVALQQVTTKIDRAQGDIHLGGNPHYLFDPRAGAAIAVALGATLGRLDPAHAPVFQQNAARLAAQLGKLAAEQSARFDKLPAARRTLVAYHASLPYLLDWLHLRQIATLEPKPGIPPNPQHVAQVLQLMRGQGAHVIAQEDFYPRSTSQTLVGLAQARLVVLPGGARFAEGETYAAHLTALADALYAALTATP
jgi:zinc/manganese transport system substrate-binding protein